MESGSTRVAGKAGDEGPEDLRRRTNGNGGVVVAKTRHREPRGVVDGLDILHERECVEIIFVRTEIEAPHLCRVIGGLPGAQQKTQILRTGSGRRSGRARILRPRAGVEDLPLMEAAVGANFNKAGPDATQRRSGTHRSEEHTSELQSPCNLVCRLLLEKKKKNTKRVKRARQRLMIYSR